MEKEKLGVFPYVIGGLSFIPLIGVFFGLVAITWGLVTKKMGGKKLALIGVGGILSTIILYSALFYFGFKQRGGVYDDLRLKMANANLVQAVQAIEFYKVQTGAYPKSLEEVVETLPKNSMVNFMDVTKVELSTTPRYFHYEKIDEESYYLLGVGSDNLPFTADDIVPDVKVGENSKVGLKIHTN